MRLALEEESAALAPELRQLTLLQETLSAANARQLQRIIEEKERTREGYQKWALAKIVDVRTHWTVPVVDKKLNAVLAVARNKKETELAALEHFPEFRKWVNGKAKTDFVGKEISTANGKRLVSWVGGYVSDGTKKVSQRITREAMIKWLLPIDTRLLDQPIAEIYNQTWAEMWGSLEGAPTDHRLAIAKKAAATRKATLDSYPRAEGR